MEIDDEPLIKSKQKRMNETYTFSSGIQERCRTPTKHDDSVILIPDTPRFDLYLLPIYEFLL